MTKEIGFIGVGRMGGPMAGRLVDGGYGIHVFDQRMEGIDAIVSKGGVAASSPADIASKVETVLVSLPTPEIVKHVVFGDKGIAEGTRIKTYVDLSTTGPTVAAEVAAALAQKGIITLGAPV